MSDQIAAAIINARVACALARIESMKAANTEREARGYALAYDEGAFAKVIDEEEISHNDVWKTIHDHR